MPSLKQSANFNTRGWRQVPNPAPSTRPQATIPPPEDTTGRDPMMLAAMPDSASGNDHLNRQFYGGWNCPTWRTLPPTGARR
jgi:hypothetical protein